LWGGFAFSKGRALFLDHSHVEGKERKRKEREKGGKKGK